MQLAIGVVDFVHYGGFERIYPLRLEQALIELELARGDPACDPEVL